MDDTGSNALLRPKVSRDPWRKRNLYSQDPLAVKGIGSLASTGPFRWQSPKESLGSQEHSPRSGGHAIAGGTFLRNCGASPDAVFPQVKRHP